MFDSALSIYNIRILSKFRLITSVIQIPIIQRVNFEVSLVNISEPNFLFNSIRSFIRTEFKYIFDSFRNLISCSDRNHLHFLTQYKYLQFTILNSIQILKFSSCNFRFGHEPLIYRFTTRVLVPGTRLAVSILRQPCSKPLDQLVNISD